ncbi:MAG TPA: adenylate kinase [Kiritimatiellia bacterium]|nr:adenylate kinase [Kiritimatiellia bacterium]HPS07565.1 adenylate kinase [Kiritimatiellia bacterium]
MKIVVLLGAPGSGKGTVAGRLLAADSTLRHVSSGDLLRDAVKRQTPAGIEAEGYMKRGELVPDGIIAQMIADLMAGINGECTLLLDGYPRTVVQAEILDQTIARCGAKLSSVVLLEVADEILVDRIAGRRGCPKCGAGYHVTNIPPRQEGVCDVCGAGLIVRKDDNPVTVKNRLAVYQAQTVPLIAFYGARGVLRRVAGTGPIDGIVERVRQVL